MNLTMMLRTLVSRKSYHGQVFSNITPSSAAYCTSNKDTKKEEVSLEDNPRAWRKEWMERDGEWYSSFKLFESEGNSPDFFRFMQQDISFRPNKIKGWWKKKQELYKQLDQRYIPERHEILGSDLATAHFIVHRGGRVKFLGQDGWIQKNEEDEYDLPDRFVKGLFLEAVDASGMELRHEGLVNLVRLYHLQELNLKGCHHMNDWCLDSLSSEFSNTLQKLDISDCPLITDRGLTILHRLRHLTELSVSGVATTPQARLVCLMLQDLNPNLVIQGMDHDIGRISPSEAKIK